MITELGALIGALYTQASEEQRADLVSALSGSTDHTAVHALYSVVDAWDDTLVALARQLPVRARLDALRRCGDPDVVADVLAGVEDFSVAYDELPVIALDDLDPTVVGYLAAHAPLSTGLVGWFGATATYAQHPEAYQELVDRMAASYHGGDSAAVREVLVACPGIVNPIVDLAPNGRLRRATCRFWHRAADIETASGAQPAVDGWRRQTVLRVLLDELDELDELAVWATPEPSASHLVNSGTIDMICGMWAASEGVSWLELVGSTCARLRTIAGVAAVNGDELLAERLEDLANRHGSRPLPTISKPSPTVDETYMALTGQHRASLDAMVNRASDGGPAVPDMVQLALQNPLCDLDVLWASVRALPDVHRSLVEGVRRSGRTYPPTPLAEIASDGGIGPLDDLAVCCDDPAQFLRQFIELGGDPNRVAGLEDSAAALGATPVRALMYLDGPALLDVGRHVLDNVPSSASSWRNFYELLVDHPGSVDDLLGAAAVLASET